MNDTWVRKNEDGTLPLSPLSVFGPFESREACEEWIEALHPSGGNAMPKLLLTPDTSN